MLDLASHFALSEMSFEEKGDLIFRLYSSGCGLRTTCEGERGGLD